MAGPPPSERTLLERCQSGDREAIAELMRLHQPALVRTVLRLVRRKAIAEEIVQESFMRTFRQIDRIDPDRGVRSWLFSVALNLSRNHAAHDWRAQLTGEVQDDAAVYLATPIRDPEERLLRDEQNRDVDAAIQKLSPKLREVVLLRYVEELPFSEVAAITGVPAPILKMRAKRARARLLELLRGSVL